VVEAVDDGLEAGHGAALVLGNSVDRAIILRRRNPEAAIDRLLSLIELTLSGIQILQCDLRTGVGVDAKGHGYSPTLSGGELAFCGPGQGPAPASATPMPCD